MYVCHLTAPFKIPALVTHGLLLYTAWCNKPTFFPKEHLAFVMSCIVITVVFVVVSLVQDAPPCFDWALNMVPNYGKEIGKGFSKVGH